MNLPVGIEWEQIQKHILCKPVQWLGGTKSPNC
jgi:hypothetical protein